MNEYPSQEQSPYPHSQYPPYQQSQYQSYAPQSPNDPTHRQQPASYQPHPYQQQPYQSSSIERQSPDGFSFIPLAGGVLALVAFAALPFVGSLTGLYLTSLLPPFWLEGFLAGFALVLAGLRVIMAPSRRRALWVLALGGAAVPVHFWLMSLQATDLLYWGIGAWLFLLGVLAIAFGGLLSFLRGGR